MSKNHVAVDVQLVATGEQCTDRALGYVCLVGEEENILYSAYVKPQGGFKSLFTPLTGITNEDMENAVTEEEVLYKVKGFLGAHTIIVAQGTRDPVKYLKLTNGEDYCDTVELAHWFKHKNYSHKACKYGYQFWTLEHEVRWLLDIDIQGRVKAGDRARYTMQLFKKYQNDQTELLKAQQTCRDHQKDIVPKLFNEHDRFEGVCTGHIGSGYQGHSCACGQQTRNNQYWTKK